MKIIFMIFVYIEIVISVVIIIGKIRFIVFVIVWEKFLNFVDV